MGPGADEYGCSFQSVGWQKSVGRISIVTRGKLQDEPRRHDLAGKKSSLRYAELPAKLTRTTVFTKAKRCAGHGWKSHKDDTP